MGKINMHSWIQEKIDTPQRCAIPIMTHPGIEYIHKTVRDAVN